MSPEGAADVDPIREVKRLHLMLEDWYGRVRTDIDPIENALAEDFRWIGPDGALHDRQSSIDTWHRQRNEYIESRPPVSVDLEAVSVARTIYGVHQVTYLKRLTVEGEDRPFRCSLWLRETQRTATGLQWLHLSETPIESEEDVDSESD